MGSDRPPSTVYQSTGLLYCVCPNTLEQDLGPGFRSIGSKGQGNDGVSRADTQGPNGVFNRFLRLSLSVRWKFSTCLPPPSLRRVCCCGCRVSLSRHPFRVAFRPRHVFPIAPCRARAGAFKRPRCSGASSQPLGCSVVRLVLFSSVRRDEGPRSLRARCARGARLFTATHRSASLRVCHHVDVTPAAPGAGGQGLC